MSVDFLLVSLVVVVSPGIGVLYTLSVAISRGPQASIIAAFGCTLGIVPHMLAAIVGLSALLNTSALAFQALKYLGVAYLLFLAWTTVRERGALTVTGATAGSARQTILKAVLVNLLNPKLSIFFFAFLPQFISADEPHPGSRMVVLSAVFMLMTFIVFAAYGLLASMARERIVSQPAVMAWMRRSFAGAFVALAARLAFVER